MAKEMMIVFVYDTECCQEEADDPVSAVLYFHPSWVSDVQKLSLCGQLMGTTHFLCDTFGRPEIITLQSGKFVLKQFGRFILAVGTDRNLPTSVLKHRANLFVSLVKFFHRDIQTIHEQFTNTGQYKNLSEKLYHIFETYLPILQHNGNVFQNMPMSRLPKSASNIFLESMQTLQSCQQTKGILGGCILYHNKVVATQMPPEMTKNLVLTDPYRIKSTAETIPVNLRVPVGVQLLVVYIPIREYRRLNVDAQRAQSVSSQTTNPIVPFQFKKKIKRDKSIIFTNIPEESVMTENCCNGNEHQSLDTSLAAPIKPRPNHLPLRFKTVSSKDIPESGFNSINFDESDSFPQFIGKTSVCSTPMTENKVLHDNFLSICANPTDEMDENAKKKKSTTKQHDFDKDFSNFLVNPHKFEMRRRNSLTDLQESFKKFSQRISIRPFGFGIGLSKLSAKTDANDDTIAGGNIDDIEIDDFAKQIYRTITDPTYPVFNSDGAPISKCLFQEFLKHQYDEMNLQQQQQQQQKTDSNDKTMSENMLIEGFDSDMKMSPIHLKKIEKPLALMNDNLIDTNGSVALSPMQIDGLKRKSLSLPLKSLSEDDVAIKNTNVGGNIFELPAQRKKLAGIQLTPLMSKLSVLAMTDERSSGFSSWDTTPGVVELSTPVDGAKLFRRRSSIKYEDVPDFDGTDGINGDGMQKVELFVCGQQNMTMFLLMDENCAQKQELIQSMFDICVSKLTRIEANLNQTLNVNVDGEKSEGGYSFISLDPHWDTLQRGGPWSAADLLSIEYMRNNFNEMAHVTDLILRTEESVLYGYHIGQSGIFYKQTAIIQNGLPPPADTMGTIPLCAKRRLERDHSIILL